MSSQVNDLALGNTLLEAMPGLTGSDKDGAPGYSGGGGDNRDDTLMTSTKVLGNWDVA